MIEKKSKIFAGIRFKLDTIRIQLIFGIVILIVLFSSCGSSFFNHPVYGDISTGYLSFEHNGIERQYALHIPETVTENAPLLLSMHGYTDDAIQHRDYTELNRVADLNGFIVAYPRGIKDKEGERFFNMGYFFHQTETVDDVGFLTELTLYLQKTYKINSERTFTAGFSNGGDLSYMLACQRPDIFKGFVSVGGLMLEDFKLDCEFTVPIPILEIRGEDDEITLYKGDINNETGWGRYPPIEETVDFWKTRNGCKTVSRDTLFGPDSGDFQRIEIMKFQDCSDDKEVWLYKITDYGHEWPQGTDDHWLNASEEIWRFLSKY
ncbi:MAG: PHB depolymerase family esterase [Bacteroidota bacterium]